MNYGLMKKVKPSFLSRFLNQTRIIVLSFLLAILIGALFLALPVSHNGELSFLNALFTATSATCVTGLTTVSLSTSLTLFGQIIVLLLVQIGGMGFMTLASATFVLVGKRFTLRERLNMRDYLYENDMSVLGSLALRVVKFTLVIETVGAVLLSIAFSFDYSPGYAIFYGIFHSVTAFCNAGIDIIPGNESMLVYSQKPLVLLILSFLIILGGIGFIVIGDMVKARKWKKLRIESKIVLTMTGALILIGALVFLISDYDYALKGMSFGDKLVNSLFLSVSTRTAGFSTLPIESFSPLSRNIMIILMFIGAAPGSTGGGIKITTTFVLLVWIIATLRNRKTTVIGMRKVGNEVKAKASTILVLAIVTVMLALSLLLIFDGDTFTYEQLLFEVVSAYATVGLSMGVTGALSLGSRLVIIVVMFMGRVGAYTLLAVASRPKNETEKITYPEFNIMM